MKTWMIEYSYDDRASEREAVRPAHRAFLSALAEQGMMTAFGRYVDEGPAGALLIAQADSRESIASALDQDPYALEGLIADRRIREWPAVWAPARSAP